MGSEMLHDIARAIDAVPGVVRREKALADWSRLLPSSRAADGVRMISNGGIVKVEVEVTTEKGRSALDVGRAVRETVRRTIERDGLSIQYVSVRILAQE